MSYNKQLILKIQEIFYIKLQEKTNWGRNDVKSLYNKSVNKALLELVDS
jgi:hypothetical protein